MINASSSLPSAAPQMPKDTSMSPTPVATAQTSGMPSFNNKKKTNWKVFGGLIALLLVVVGSVAAFYLSQTSQELRQQASTEGPPGGDLTCLATQRNAETGACGGKVSSLSKCTNACSCGYTQGDCGSKAAGETCYVNGQCLSGKCTGGKCEGGATTTCPSSYSTSIQCDSNTTNRVEHPTVPGCFTCVAKPQVNCHVKSANCGLRTVYDKTECKPEDGNYPTTQAGQNSCYTDACKAKKGSSYFEEKGECQVQQGGTWSDANCVTGNGPACITSGGGTGGNTDPTVGPCCIKIAGTENIQANSTLGLPKGPWTYYAATCKKSERYPGVSSVYPNGFIPSSPSQCTFQGSAYGCYTPEDKCASRNLANCGKGYSYLEKSRCETQLNNVGQYACFVTSDQCAAPKGQSTPCNETTAFALKATCQSKLSGGSTGGGGTGGTSGVMCQNDPTKPVKKWLKFVCKGGCQLTTEGGVSAYRCYEGRVESTTELHMNPGECGQVDQLYGDTDATYCGYKPEDYTCGKPECQAPPEQTTYSCDSPCTTDAQCQTANANLKCDAAAGNRCRLATNPTSQTCQPATGPMCLKIRMNNLTRPEAPITQDPNMGDSVNFVCGAVDGVDHYQFRIWEPGADQPSRISASDTRKNQSESYTIAKSGKFFVQCRICTGPDRDSCHPWENINSARTNAENQ